MPKSDNQQPTWSIRAVFSEAWHITRRHKALWLLGLSVSVLTATSSGNQFNSRSSESTDDPADVQSYFDIEGRLELFGLSQSSLQTFGDRIESDVLPGFTDVSMSSYGFLILISVLLAIFGSILGIAGMHWAGGALRYGVRQAVVDDAVDIEQASQLSLERLGSMVALHIIPILKPVAILLGVVFGTTIFAIVTEIGVVMLLVIAAVIYFIVRMIRIMLALVWAPWHLIEPKENPGYRSAFEMGSDSAKGRFGKVLLHALALGILQLIVFSILMSPLIALIGYVVWGSVSSNNYLFALNFVWPLIIAFILMAQIGMAMSSVLHVFGYTSWQLAFRNIRGPRT